MSAQLGAALGWKFNHAPGICTVDGVITDWPESLGAMPTQEQITAWAAEYEAALNAPPRVVTMRQARLALLQAGLLPTVNAALAAAPGETGEAARIEWEFAANVDRDSALVAGFAAALGISEATLDAIFTSAAEL